MKTLFPALRVSDIDASLGFYAALGYELVGSLEPGPGIRLVMLALAGQDEVSLELVHRASESPSASVGLDHLAVQVDDVVALRAALVAAGFRPGDVARPGGPDGPQTVSVADPDGHPLELVQWPPNHPVDMTRHDFLPGDRA